MAAGIKAVIESAHIVTPHDIWVDVEDSPEALRQAKKLSPDNYKPRVYAPGKGSEIADKKVCLRLE
jgi:hypothetical protein